jgi:L-ascorbate metabolism protein UlaG (beta-lactamase superfamily)
LTISNSKDGKSEPARSKESRVTYLGHASLLIETGGVRILTDPILRQRIFFLQRTHPTVDRAYFQDIDAVLISHLHYDHLDIHSLRMLENSYQLIIPQGAAPVMDKNGFKEFQEVQIEEEINIGTVSVKATFADHISRRLPFGALADCLGFVISGDINVYFPGDTRLFPEMAALGDEDLDLALLPVWGWGYHRGRMHMGPKEAAQALELLHPKVAVPIHWGTFIPMGIRWLKPPFYYLPPIEFARHAKQIAPKVAVRILKPGEAVIFNKT